MSIEVRDELSMIGGARITGLPTANANGQPVVLEQLNAIIEGFAPKDNVRVSTQGNTNLASPGASIDGVSLTSGDRVLVRAQTSQPENGLYVWNGAAVAMTRSSDASVFDELESARVSVDEGTNAGTEWRQTQVNGVIGTNNVVWAQTNTGASAATETTSGIAEIATQAETDSGTDDQRFVTPLKAKSASWAPKRSSGTFGDGSATQFDVTHNLSSTDVIADVRKVSDGTLVLCGARPLNANTLRLNFAAAPTTNELRVTVLA